MGENKCIDVACTCGSVEQELVSDSSVGILREGEVSQTYRCRSCGRMWRKLYTVKLYAIIDATTEYGDDTAVRMLDEDQEIYRKVRKYVKMA